MSSLSIWRARAAGPRLACRREIRAVAAVTFLAALTAFLLPERFRSEARILPVETRSAAAGSLMSAAALLGVNLPGNEGGDGNFVDILESRWMAERLLETEFAFQDRAFPWGPPRARHMTLAQYLRKRNPDRAVAKVHKLLTARRDLKSKIITVTAETRSPELSQAIVRQACARLEQFVLTKGQTRGGSKVVFTEGRLGEAREELRRVEARFRRFLEVNRNYQTSPDPAVHLEGQAIEAEYKLRTQLVATLSVNLEQALMEEKNDVPIVSLLDSGNRPWEKSWPPRSIIIAGAALLAASASLAWRQRAWIVQRCLELGADQGRNG